jgi:biopolymer transport protein ExbD
MAMTSGQKAQINITPMIDVLLVLIVIFMVITPLTQRGLRTLLPQPAPPDQSAPPQTSDIVITVRADGLRLNQEPVDIGNLKECLSRLFQVAPDHVIFVRAEKDLEFRTVAEVIDIANGVGLNRVALMSE